MKTTKRALFSSVVALILCFSMLVGTTFAWFTDEVKSGTNQIVAGNLDVNLYHSDDNVKNEPVTVETKLFDDVNPNLWEPGALAYEILTVKDSAERTAKSIELQKLLAEECPQVPLYVADLIIAYRNGLTGTYFFGGGNHVWTHAYVAK